MSSIGTPRNLAIHGGLGFASGPDGWWISYRGRMFQTQDLLTAAQHLHRAIRAAVDPEAFSDFPGEHPFIELRDPAAIVKPWRPGSGIVARQAAAIPGSRRRCPQADQDAQSADSDAKTADSDITMFATPLTASSSRPPAAEPRPSAPPNTSTPSAPPKPFPASFSFAAQKRPRSKLLAPEPS